VWGGGSFFFLCVGVLGKGFEAFFFWWGFLSWAGPGHLDDAYPHSCCFRGLASLLG